MKTKLGIKNFRVFDENGVTIELSPITILTGKNSSGKSSITKAMVLLNSVLNQLSKGSERWGNVRFKAWKLLDLNDYTIDLSSYPNNLLGSFSNIVHKGSQSNNIIFEYELYSLMLSETVSVSLVFGADATDQLSGNLDGITIKTERGVFFRLDKTEGCFCNFNVIKESCVELFTIQSVRKDRNDLQKKYDEGSITKDQFEEKSIQIESTWEKFDEHRRNELCKFLGIYFDESDPCFLYSNPSIAYWSKEHGSLFYIPIVEDLDKLNKTEIKPWLDDTILKKDAPVGLIARSHRIIDSFVSSDCASFLDFFKQYEQKFLDERKLTTVNSPIDLFHLRSFIDWTVLPEDPLLDFRSLYLVVMEWNKRIHDSQCAYYDDWERHLGYDEWDDDQETDHYMFEVLMKSFASDLIQEALTPDWAVDVEYVSSTRVKVCRDYSFINNDDFSELLKKYFEAKRKSENSNFAEYDPDGFLNKWARAFEICEKGGSIYLTRVPEGAVRIGIRQENGTEHLLADEGYGLTQLVSLLLQIEYTITSNSTKQVRGLYDTSIIIEEPEIHLHPNFQSMLAEMFVDAYKNHKIQFIIETHSEYLIRKLQVMIADLENSLAPNDVSLNYVEKGERGMSTLRKINIMEDGRLAEPFGRGFFDESKSLVMQMLKF